ncbi:hypothetical protein BU23DRAFT_559461 [Bimuria novae-zelandiae CBS 107.79]|uniref:WSC domain-containing protein n=1 Tax=Bimuria novae-zelandiae CBS 107.79 TaxID=1447943 RepID=A0A6A5UPY5_9PLEO|nr:hypothetical protein BU23DRAFT_559461 [Bimuria novae-zelandiae CBS 107.79]
MSFFHVRCVALLGLLTFTHTVAQSFNNVSIARTKPSTPYNSTVTPSPSRTLNSTSSEAYIQSCNSAWQSYISNIKFGYSTTSTTGPPITSTSYLGIQTCSSYCGSICYADTKSITATRFITETYPNIQYSRQLTYSEPAPNCTIPPAECRKLWSEYTTAEASWSSWNKPGGIIPPSPITPGCTVGCTRTTCAFGGGDKGIAPTPGVIERYWNSLQVYYFPETRSVSRDMCATRNTNPPVPFPTADPGSYIPTTTEGFVMVDGKTFYKGNVYISISQMEVFDNCGYHTVMDDVAFPVASSNVLSERADIGTSRFFNVEWADFNEPVPYSAYVGGLSRTFSAIDPGRFSDPVNFCKTAICATKAVYPESFHPWILLPPEVKHLDPAFADCDLRYDLSFFDPPIALHGVPNFLTTASSDPVATPAQPASSVIALPVRTSKPASIPTFMPIHPHGPYDPPTSTAKAPPYDPLSVDPAHNGQVPNGPAPIRPGSGGHLVDPPQASDGGFAGKPAASTHAGSNDPEPGNAAPNRPNTEPPASGPQGSEFEDPGILHPTGNNVDPAASRTNAPAGAPRPQITIGPTILPVAPNGQGLIIHSSTTIAPSGSAVIDGTTLYMETGVLTMVSPSGTLVSTVEAAGKNGVGAVVALGNGATITISSAGSSLVFDVETTLESGDPAQTIESLVVSVGSNGIHIDDTRNGDQTSIVFADIEGFTTAQDGSVNAVVFAGAESSTGIDAVFAEQSGSSVADAESEPTISGIFSSSMRASMKGSVSIDSATTTSASDADSTGAGGYDGSETGAPSNPVPDLGTPRAVYTPWHSSFLFTCILALFL